MPMRGESFRFWLPALLLVLFAAYVTQKIVRVHLCSGASENDPDKVYRLRRDLPALRGTICDRFGDACPLVKSVPVWEYSLDPVSLTNRIVRSSKKERPRARNAILKTIAHALKLKYADVLAMADRKGGKGWRNQRLAVSSDPEAHRILSDSCVVAGVAIRDRQERRYLHGRRLAHVLGSVNANGDGTGGVEQRFHGELTGTPGVIVGMKDARNNEIYDRRKVSTAPVPGATVRLTVDHNVQFEVEEALAWGCREFGAAAAWGIVMDSRSGAVLAMASLPDFEPNEFGNADDESKLNRAVALCYEPGSVMKVITAAAAINAGRATPDTRYGTNRDDKDYYRLPGDGAHVWEPTMTIRDAIVHSSNIVIGKLGYDLGPETLWGYMKEFGFGERTGIELPGEQAGILPNWRKWDKVKWSRAPIGQGVSVTAIQLASAYQAIANDGLRMKPHVVESVVGAKGEVEYRHVDTPLGRPISAATARTLREMMLGVASGAGTARRAALRGYSVAGKTGTAQKVVDGRYSDRLFRATFCGMLPADSPRLVILVTLDFNERTPFHQGGNSAGPVFRRIAAAATRYLMIPPDKPEEMDDPNGNDEYDALMDARARELAARDGAEIPDDSPLTNAGEN